jgi:signal transduction histidine kinase
MLTIHSDDGALSPTPSAGAGDREMARLRELLRINRLILGALDPVKVVPLVVERTALLIGADACLLLMAEGDRRATVRAAIGVDPQVTDGFSAPLDEHLDVALRGMLGIGELDELMAVPVVAGGVIDGVLAACWRGPSRARAADEFLLSAMADQTAIALAHAVSYQRMYRSEREAREMAEGAVRSRDDFLAMVSHDLRNPLATISMSADLLLDQMRGAIDPSARVQAERIQRSVGQMLRLVDDLLDVAKMEAGTFSIERSPHDAVALAREVIDPFSLTARERSIQLDVELPAGLLPIACDRQRVLQVLSNLLGNAIKFTPKGGRVLLQVLRRADEAVFSVRDTGRGIPADQLPHVFERFWRADRQSQRSSGLGLFIARSLVQAHSGRIWAESEVGVGSTFFFALALLPDSSLDAGGDTDVR